MNAKKTYTIQTSDLIAICNIFPEYEEFGNDLSAILKDADIRKIGRAIHGKIVFLSKQEREFYHQNRELLKRIEDDCGFFQFVCLNYTLDGSPREDGLEGFLQYLKEHQEDMDKILLLLTRIRELGFSKISLKEGETFASDVHDVSKTFSWNNHLIYLENMEAIPAYPSNSIFYRSTGSNYKMTLSSNITDLSTYGRKIALNNLLFDPSCLPQEITKESIFGTLLGLERSKEQEYQAIRNSVSLSVGIEDLGHQLETTERMIQALDGVKNKEELKAVLASIACEIARLEGYRDAYQISLGRELGLTEERLEEEKQKYYKRREFSKLDLD